MSSLTSEELEGLPTNNLLPERDFSQFDRVAKVAKCRNRNFKAKNIRNNMVVFKLTKSVKVTRILRKISEILSSRELKWDAEQKQKLKNKIEEKLEKVKKSQDYTSKLLKDSKSWGGPCTSDDELISILHCNLQKQEQIVKTELAFYSHSHHSERIASPELFKMNRISHEEKLCTFEG